MRKNRVRIKANDNDKKVVLLAFLLGIVVGMGFLLVLKTSLNHPNSNYVEGNGNQSSSNLTDEQLKWGAVQVRQMLKDRPAMKPYVKEGDDLWNWAVRKFAGEDVKEGLEWRGHDLPGEEWDAANAQPDPPQYPHGIIWVTEKYTGKWAPEKTKAKIGQKKTGPILWFQLVAEIFNIQNAHRSKNVGLRAASGNSTRISFAIEQELIESELWPKLFHFYKYLWIPHCRKLSLPHVDPEFKDVIFPGDKYVDKLPEDEVNYWLTHLKTDYHVNYWLKRYDEKHIKK